VISPPYEPNKMFHDRYSIAFFNQPLSQAVLEPVIAVEEISADKLARLQRKGVEPGKRITSLEHLQMRLNSTYTGRKQA